MLHRRRVFLINKPFQLRFAFYVSSWLIALSFIYPLIIFNLFNYLMRYLALDPTGPTVASLETTREELLWLLVVMHLILLSMTFLMSIFMSHRITGPLAKLAERMRNVTAGHFSEPLLFRKKDYFQELVIDFNNMSESIQHRLTKKSDRISIAITHLQKGLAQTNSEAQPELEAALRALQEAQVDP